MALTNDIIDLAVERYWREYDRYAKLSEFIGDACQKLLDDNVIRGSVQWRPKSVDRLRQKLQKQMASGDHAEQYINVESVFGVLKDLAGARITTYVETDRKRIVDLVGKRFNGFGESDSVVAEKKDKIGDIYRATHCMVCMKDLDLVGRYANLKGLGCELQVCSMLAHVYNEIEHDLRYKPLAGELAKHETGLLDILGKLMETGDRVITETLDAVETRQKQKNAEFEDMHDFVVRTRELFPAAHYFRINAGQLYDACVELGLDSLEKLKQALNWQPDTASRGQKLAEELANEVNANQNIQLEIDPTSSDQLLVLLLDDKRISDKLKELYPSGRGIGRAPRFLSVAKQLQKFREKNPSE